MKIQPDKFFLHKSFALFGLSKKKGSISLQIFRLLVKHGYTVLPIICTDSSTGYWYDIDQSGLIVRLIIRLLD